MSLSTAHPQMTVYSDKSKTSRKTISVPFVSEFHIVPYAPDYSVSSKAEENRFEDRGSHFRYGGSTFLYAVFQGRKKEKTANFALPQLAAKWLIGDLNGKFTEDEVEGVLRKALIAIQRGYLDAIVDILADKANLQFDIPDSLSCYEIHQKFHQLANELIDWNCNSSVGTSVVVALIHTKRLYVVKFVGSGALFSKTDSDRVLRAIPLRIDHDLSNEDELRRSYEFGLYRENIERAKDLWRPFGRRKYSTEKRKILPVWLEPESIHLNEFFTSLIIPGLNEEIVTITRKGWQLFFLYFDGVRKEMTNDSKDLNDVIRYCNKLVSSSIHYTKYYTVCHKLPDNTQKNHQKKKKSKFSWKRSLKKILFLLVPKITTQ